MDSLTHLVAGALTPLAFRGMPRRAAVVGFGMAAGQLPDIDVLFGGTPEALLTLHRGITHSVFWQPVLVLLAAIPFYLWLGQRPLSAPPPATAARPFCHGSRRGLGLGLMWLIALIAGYTHLYLDCMTTFGTQILLPLSPVRVGYPAMFIVDLLLTLPALTLLFLACRQEADWALAPGSGGGLRPEPRFSAASCCLARLGLAWVLLYPVAAYGCNLALAARLKPLYAPDRPFVLMTEPFSPLIWKGVADDGDSYRMGTVLLPAPHRASPWVRYYKPDPVLYSSLKRQQPLFAFFEEFCGFLVQEERPADPVAQSGYREPIREYLFADLRYIMSPDSPAHWVGRSDATFVLQARVNGTGALVAYRFLSRGRALETPWIALQ